MPLAVEAQNKLAVLQAEILADIIVSKVAKQVVIHLRKLVEAVDCGSTIGSIEIPEGTVLLDEEYMNKLMDKVDPTGKWKVHFNLAGVNFSKLLTQRLQSAHQRGLIPEVYYDHWEIGTGRLSA